MVYMPGVLGLGVGVKGKGIKVQGDRKGKKKLGLTIAK
jgi:hypothetical protein